MKKAKDYYKEILVVESFGDIEKIKSKIKDVLKDFILEIRELADIRNVSTDAGLLSIIKEQNNKWNALCNKCEYLTRDAIDSFTASVVGICKP